MKKLLFLFILIVLINSQVAKSSLITIDNASKKIERHDKEIARLKRAIAELKKGQR